MTHTFGPYEYKGRNYAYASQVDRERLNDAAPELLEALKVMVAMLSLWQATPERQKAVNRARAAIAKVEGKQ